jgi:hypothetical protein
MKLRKKAERVARKIFNNSTIALDDTLISM